MLDDLNFEKGIEMDETKKIEARLGKLNIAKRVTDTIKHMNFVNIMIKS